MPSRENQGEVVWFHYVVTAFGFPEAVYILATGPHASHVLSKLLHKLLK